MNIQPLAMYRSQFLLICLLIGLASCGIPENQTQALQPQSLPPAQLTLEPTPLPSATTERPQPTPTVGTSARAPSEFYSDPGFAEELRQQLQRTDLDANLRQSLEEKLRIEDQNAILRATTQAKIADGSLVPPTGYAPLPGPTDPPPPRGIIEGASGPFSSSDFVVQNMWQDEIDGIWVVIHAGANGDDRKQGALSVVRRLPTGIKGGRYPTPQKSGSIRIVAVKDTLVSVIAEDGSTYIFDLPKQTWIP
jgi:hypothetical protein